MVSRLLVTEVKMRKPAVAEDRHAGFFAGAVVAVLIVSLFLSISKPHKSSTQSFEIVENIPLLE